MMDDVHCAMNNEIIVILLVQAKSQTNKECECDWKCSSGMNICASMKCINLYPNMSANFTASENAFGNKNKTH